MKTISELSPTVKDLAFAAFKKYHEGKDVEVHVAPDRAWIEGWAHAYESARLALSIAAPLMDEAASLLEKMNPSTLEMVEGFRYPLTDELGGAANMCREAFTDNAPSDKPPAPPPLNRELIDNHITEMVERVRLTYHASQRDGLTRGELVRARCTTFTAELVAAFPTLKRVSGFYCHPGQAGDEIPGVEHWWCVAPDGQIIDPTVEQFTTGGVYVVFNPKVHLVYKGSCMNCGAEDYSLASAPVKSVCSKECGDALEAVYNR